MSAHQKRAAESLQVTLVRKTDDASAHAASRAAESATARRQRLDADSSAHSTTRAAEDSETRQRRLAANAARKRTQRGDDREVTDEEALALNDIALTVHTLTPRQELVVEKYMTTYPKLPCLAFNMQSNPAAHIYNGE
jgi:hypothetical protein